jgi:hypothetical protein
LQIRNKTLYQRKQLESVALVVRKGEKELVENTEKGASSRSRGLRSKSIVFLPLIEILTKIINHTNKETVYNPLTGKKPIIFARWVPPNIWLRLFNTPT